MDQEGNSLSTPQASSAREAAPAANSPDKRRKRKGTAGKTLLKVVIWVVVIALIIFLTLFIASKIGQFESIGAMLIYIRGQF